MYHRPSRYAIAHTCHNLKIYGLCSETLVPIYKTTRCHIAEYCPHTTDSHEDLKSQIKVLVSLHICAIVGTENSIQIKLPRHLKHFANLPPHVIPFMSSSVSPSFLFCSTLPLSFLRSSFLLQGKSYDKCKREGYGLTIASGWIYRARGEIGTP
jgi:hypothetical protein